MKIVIGSANRASFVLRDAEILSQRHEVTHFTLHNFGFADLIRRFKHFYSADVVLLWFATPRFLVIALMARLLGKPLAVVVGGYEAASLPEFSYGSARSRLTSLPTRILLRFATSISVVSESSRHSLMRNFGVDAARIKRIYHGFTDIRPLNPPARAKRVITIGMINQDAWEIKGIRDFLLVAEQLPEIEFVHIGGSSLDVRAQLGREPAGNIRFIGAVPYEEIGEHLAASSIYLQLSRHESFGCAVAEAMLCGCVPVVADAFALPEVVGDVGVVLNDRNPVQIAEELKRVIDPPDSRRDAARMRVLTMFPLEKRREELDAWLSRLAIGS